VTELLADKTGLVVGVANKRSIAWAIAQRLDGAGARLALSFQNERVEREVRPLAESLSRPGPVVQLDVQDDAGMDAAVEEAAGALGGLDILVHAVAYAPAADPDRPGLRAPDHDRGKP
jgi:enoyl-[acyl-carrier protein] reductase I